MNDQLINTAKTNPSSPQAAIHYRANLVPIPQPFWIAPQYLDDRPLEEIQSGLTALHHLISAIYQAGVERPDALIPPGLSRRKQALNDADITAYLRLLFALGLLGERAKDAEEGKDLLVVESHSLNDFCKRARIVAYEPYFLAMAQFGLVYLPFQPLQFCFPSEPDLLFALSLFARTCRPLTIKDINPPVEFLRADMRLFHSNRKKVRTVTVNPEEAIRTLCDEKEADFVRSLDAWARSAGYTVQVKCNGAYRSEFSAKYYQPKPRRVLFGFDTESGRLKMHLNFNQTDRILPHIAQAPRSFRALFFQNCNCAACGACQEGPLKIELDDQLRRLCRFAYFNLPEVLPEHYDAIQRLVKAQDAILKKQ